MSSFDDQIANLTPAQRALLEQRLRRRRAARKGEERIARRPDAADAPLSFAQQRLWFLDQLAPGNPFYNVPLAYRVLGRLDRDALGNAFSALVRRHETLRTTIGIVESGPVQRIARAQPVDIPVFDLEGFPESEREQRSKAWVADEVRRPFDLTRGPLLRARLLRLRDEEHVLVITVHHIISDGWSVGILIRELSQLYEEFAGGSPAALPELTVQYGDFAAWQREWLSGSVLENQLAYWRKQLADLSVLELTTDRPRPAEQTFRGGRERVVLAEKLMLGLREFSRREGATLFMTLLAGFQALLSRYTGQEDIVVGSPIANRTRSEIEGLIGFFANTLTLRTDLTGDPTFRELLGRVKNTALEAYSHQDLPFERLVEDLQPERKLAQNPLVQVLFAVQNAPGAALDLPGITLVPLPVESETTRLDLEVYAHEKADGIACTFVYATDLFNRSTVRRLAAHYERLLEEIVADPDVPISQITLLPDAERKQILEEWNQTTRHYPLNLTVVGLFEEQVARTPESVAVSFGSNRLTYQELDDQATRLARYLVARGIAPDSLVGLLVERSLDMVVGVLGILKAGAAYVPLDPAYPRERLAFVIDDAALAIVVTQKSLVDSLPAAVECFALDGDSPRLVDGGRLERRASPGSLAYVIYTSGSTGRPKGVAIEHWSVVNLLLSMQERLGLGSKDVLLAVTTLSFDIAALEIYLPLSVGASVAICPRETAYDGKALRAEISRSGATVMQATPVSWRLLLDAGWGAGELKTVLCGGEALARDLADRLIERSATAWNLYGPTETTIWSTAARLEIDERGVSIGTPLANTQVFNLDSNGVPVAIGLPGELHIGGAGLARGYWNRPDLTEKSFRSLTLGGSEPRRVYRTGDRVRFREDGSLEYLGRLDQQVKLRGFRIELGEVETVIRKHPAVKNAVVVLRQDGSNAGRLVAYVVPNQADEDELPGESRTPPEQLDQWRTVWEELYSQNPAADLAFDLAGWTSSYTGRPLPEGEMREWVNNTVDRILTLQPKQVLEIGCGTGLLMLRIAPHCTRYVATDFSPRVLRQLEEALLQRSEPLSGVELLVRSADDHRQIPRHEFDTVVLNSVIQYFPSVSYLFRALEAAVEAVADGGVVFVGDVRSLPLLEAFCLSVELEQAAPSLPLEELRRRVARRIRSEEELVIDQRFFFGLQKRLPRIRRVEVLPKLGEAENELTRYRYDVILRVGALAETERSAEWIDWSVYSSLLELRRILREDRPEALEIANFPNARNERDVRALELIRRADPPRTAGELRAILDQSPRRGIDPAELWRSVRAESYCIDLSSADPTRPGEFDASLRPEFASAGHLVRFPVSDPGAKPLSRYANDPTAGSKARQLVPKLRAQLQESLPDYMIPSALVVLDEIPLTPNGKVDRRALPEPDASDGYRQGDFVAPENAVEDVLAGIYAQVLGADRISVGDDFFDLGGHSLLATQVISRIRDAFRVELPLRSLFEAPAVRGLAGKVATAIQDQSGSAAPPILPGPREKEPVLSFGQQRLWFLDQLESGGSFYTLSRPLRLVGNLDRTALERAWVALIRRHEALRSRFESSEGRPILIVDDEPFPPQSFVDLRDVPDEQRKTELGRRIQSEIARPFDLSTGPLLRGSLFRIGDSDHVLLVSIHHIVSDGWSLGILVRELAAYYAAFTGGPPAQLAALPVQYSDFARWQRDWLRGETLESQLSYWKTQLASVPVLELPTDRPRPPAQTFRGGRHSITLPAWVSHGLERLARREGATLYMTLLAAFQALLSRYTGQEDIVVGSPIAGRNRAEVEGLIGFFVNTLVLRTNLSGDPSFREVISRVREVALGAYTHQDLPFEKLVEELQPERDLSLNPLFQVLFALQNAPRASFELLGLTVSGFPVESRTTRFDLEVHLWEGGGQIQAVFVYATDLFEPSTIERMARHFQTILEGVVANPDRRLWELPLLTEPERHQLVVEFNETRAEYPRGQTVLGLFEEQVQKTPGADALVCGDERISYRQLNERANRLARYLGKRNVGPGVLVGLCVKRSVEMAVGLLGILKAGGAYVPLDPSYPRQRLAFMLEDASSPLVLTQRRLEDALPEGGWERVRLDADEAEIAREPGENPSREPTAEDLAYVIYTSGSTGKPKGVAMAHRALLNLVHWQMRASRNPSAKTLQFSSLSFDVSFQEMFSTWCSGGELLLVSEEVRRDPVALWQLLSSESVERLFLPFVALQHLAEAAESEGQIAPNLQEVITAGEQLRVTPEIARLFKRGGSRVLQNQYGPSESHVVTAFTLPPDPEGWPPLPPIGRPIANARIYLLDRNRQPVPIGVTGELHIGGVGVARGYWKRPELTAERFLPDPFATGEGTRLYKTGDLARYRSDGEIEFLGRLDQQVKIRGHRVEIGEIEDALSHHPKVRVCAVTTGHWGSGDNRLVGYVVPREAVLPSVTELRDFLKTTLPDYMVPSVFVFRDAFPLTPSGKLDRRALPPPEHLRPDLEDHFVAPRNPVEATIAGVWSEVLGLERVGVNDNFFDLGGHSLLGTIVFARLLAVFPVRLTLRTLFEKPTVSELASAIEELCESDPTPVRSPIVPISRQKILREEASASPESSRK